MLADDFLYHEVSEIFLSVKFVIAFVRLQSNYDSGMIPITREDVEMSRSLSENPEKIFGDRKIWGLCGIEGDGQHGYVFKVDWQPKPRRISLPATRPRPPEPTGPPHRS
jgi:hypothetical protein